MLISYMRDAQIVYRLGDQVILRPARENTGVMVTDYGLLGNKRDSSVEVFIHTAVGQSDIRYYALASGQALELLHLIIKHVRSVGPAAAAKLINLKGVQQILQCVHNDGQSGRDLASGVAGVSLTKVADLVKSLKGRVPEPDDQAPAVSRQDIAQAVAAVVPYPAPAVLDKVAESRPASIQEAIDHYMRLVR